MNKDWKKAIVKLMVVIIDRDHVKKLQEIYNHERIRFHYICMAEGTAGSDIMDILGLGSSNKAVLLCLEPEIKISHLLSKYSEKLQLQKKGRGIAFTIPLSGINHPVAQLLSKEVVEKWNENIEREVNKMRNSAKHDLIISIVNEGFSEDLMTAAKEAGAAGGTILHGKRIGHEDAEKFLGISIQAEKEIIAILTPNEKTHQIMKAICHETGISTKAHGIVFSLPVDHIEGLEF